jgi:hypothetical protein
MQELMSSQINQLELANRAKHERLSALKLPKIRYDIFSYVSWDYFQMTCTITKIYQMLKIDLLERKVKLDSKECD